MSGSLTVAVGGDKTFGIEVKDRLSTNGLFAGSNPSCEIERHALLASAVGQSGNFDCVGHSIRLRADNLPSTIAEGRGESIAPAGGLA